MAEDYFFADAYWAFKPKEMGPIDSVVGLFLLYTIRIIYTNEAVNLKCKISILVNSN